MVMIDWSDNYMDYCKQMNIFNMQYEFEISIEKIVKHQLYCQIDQLFLYNIILLFRKHIMQITENNKQEKVINNRAEFRYTEYSKNREKAQSLFRIHFALKNVFISKEQSIQQLIDNVRLRVSKVGLTHCIQIESIVDQEHVDMQIGMKFDHQAINFLHSGTKKILIKDETGNLKQTAPIITDTFAQYMISVNKTPIYETEKNWRENQLSRMRKQKQQTIQGPVQPSPIENAIIQANHNQNVLLPEQDQNIQKIENEKLKNSSKQENSQNYPESHQNSKNKQSESKSNIKDQDRYYKQRSRSRSRNDYNSRSRQYNPNQKNRYDSKKQYYNREQFLPRIFILGIPLQFNYKQIEQAMHYEGIEIDSMVWRTEEKMDVLEVSLRRFQDVRKLQEGAFYLKDYPVLVIVKERQSMKLVTLLKDYQVKVNIRRSILLEDTIDYLTKFGQIIVLIAENQNQTSFYVIYNSFSAVRRLLDDSYNSSTFECYHPKNPILLRRLRRQQIFVQIQADLQKARNEQQKSKKQQSQRKSGYNSRQRYGKRRDDYYYSNKRYYDRY